MDRRGFRRAPADRNAKSITNMISQALFRVAPYSPSTSRVTAHQDKAASLHKFLGDQGMSVEPMIEATGTVLLGFLDEDGSGRVEPQLEIISFIADATPAMLAPLLKQWLDTHQAAPAASEAAT